MFNFILSSDIVSAGLPQNGLRPLDGTVNVVTHLQCMRRGERRLGDNQLLVPLPLRTHLYGVCKVYALHFESVLRTYA